MTVHVAHTHNYVLTNSKCYLAEGHIGDLSPLAAANRVIPH